MDLMAGERSQQHEKPARWGTAVTRYALMHMKPTLVATYMMVTGALAVVITLGDLGTGGRATIFAQDREVSDEQAICSTTKKGREISPRFSRSIACGVAAVVISFVSGGERRTKTKTAAEINKPTAAEMGYR